MYERQTKDYLTSYFYCNGVNWELRSGDIYLITEDLERIQKLIFELIRDLSRSTDLTSGLVLSTIINKVRIRKVTKLIEIYFI